MGLVAQYDSSMIETQYTWETITITWSVFNVIITICNDVSGVLYLIYWYFVSWVYFMYTFTNTENTKLWMGSSLYDEK